MKITFIITSLEGFGGTNRVATLLANGLSLHHDITVLSRYSNENTYFLNDRVKDIKFTGNDFSFVCQCKKYITQTQPDNVLIHTMSKLTPALILSGVRANNIWSIEHISFEFHSLLFKQLRKWLYKKVSKVITLTENDAMNYKPFHPDITVMINPTPLQLKTSISEPISKTVVSIGRLTYQKGYDLLVDAWLTVEQRCPNWSLHIYGEGEDKNRLQQKIAKNNIKNITLKGLTDDVQNVYDNAAFYVMSSRFEGLPVVLIEAQSRGLPIVSFNCPSGPTAIVHHNSNGLLVDNGNTLAMAESIIKLIQNSHLRETMSKQALKSAEAYQIDTVIKRWLCLLEDS